MSSVARLGEGDVFAGEYQIEKVLREGTSPLYAVKRSDNGQPFSLRLLSRSVFQGNEHRMQLFDAVKNAAALHSSHIVKVVNIGVEAGTEIPWLLWEPLYGEDLESVLRQRGALPVGLVRQIFIQLGQALGQAHQAGLVHGALRPRNIWLNFPSENDKPPSLQLLDLGLAQFLAEHEQIDGNKGSTIPQWLAPEQTQGLPLMPATDVWALGLLAFRLLTGSYYWRTANRKPPVPLSILREVMLEQTPEALARAAEYGRADRLPSGFDAWFRYCLDPRVSHRYPNAQVAVAALEEVLGGKTPSAPVVIAAVAGDASAPTTIPTARPITRECSGPRMAPVARAHAGRSGRAVILASAAVLVVVSSMSVRVYYGQADVVRKPFDPTATGVQSPATTPLESKPSNRLTDTTADHPPSSRSGSARINHSRPASPARTEPRQPTPNGHRPELLQRMLKGESKPRIPLTGPPHKTDCAQGSLSSCLGLNPPDVKPLQSEAWAAPAEPVCQSAADCLTQGRTARTGSRPDATKALRLFTRSCELGSGAGCLETGRLLRKGEGTLPDEARAQEYLSRGCDRGDTASCQELLSIVKHACEQGNPSACVQAGRQLESGTGTPRDVSQASRFFEQACRGGATEGCRRYQMLQSQPSSSEV